MMRLPALPALAACLIGIATVIAAGVSVASTVGPDTPHPADGQTPGAVATSDAQVLDTVEVLAEGVQFGPGMWRVHRDGRSLWIPSTSSTGSACHCMRRGSGDCVPRIHNERPSRCTRHMPGPNCTPSASTSTVSSTCASLVARVSGICPSAGFDVAGSIVEATDTPVAITVAMPISQAARAGRADSRSIE